MFSVKTDGWFCVQVHKMPSKPSFWIFISYCSWPLFTWPPFSKNRHFIDVWYATYEKGMYCRYILLSEFSEWTHPLCSRNRTSPILRSFCLVPSPDHCPQSRTQIITPLVAHVSLNFLYKWNNKYILLCGFFLLQIMFERFTYLYCGL